MAKIYNSPPVQRDAKFSDETKRNSSRINSTSAQDTKHQNKNNSMTLVATTLQCLTNKTQALQILADSERIHILCISEHWLTPNNAGHV